MATFVFLGLFRTTSCFNPSRLRRSKSKTFKLISSSSRSKWNSCDMEKMGKKRVDSLESWSMILQYDNIESWEVHKEYQYEWTIDWYQLFIGKKFDFGSHTRIYRRFYKKEQFL